MTELFTVAKSAPITGLSTTSYGQSTISMPNKCITYVRETGEPLGVVGNDYNIMQPTEVYDLVENITGNAPTVRWNGKVMIMQSKINSMLLPGDDEVDTMFTVVNSFDGTSSLHAMGISFRMICHNQLNMALRQSKENNLRYSMRHKGDFDSKLEAFVQASESIARGHAQFERRVAALVQRKVTSGDIESLWKQVTPVVLNLTKNDIENKKDLQELRIKGFVNYCKETYETERDRGIPDSMWLAANAVTKFIQHNESTRGRKVNEDTRYIDNAVGLRSKLISKVMNHALQEV